MKRLTTVILLLLGVTILTSCHKTKDEWTRFYGYTKADILGDYGRNPDNSVYDELPTEGVIVYPEAEISITEYDDTLVNFRITIPNVWYRNFRGVVALNEGDSEISIGNDDNSDLLVTVYKNAQNQVRLDGRARVPCHWDQFGPDDYHIYGFDVVKIEENNTK